MFIAKLLLHIVICIPIIIIDGIIFAIFSPANILSKVLFFICLFVFAVLYSVEGLWTNTIAPKFNWDNEVQVIKQGTALISMLVSIGITIIIYVPSVVLSLFVPQLAILFVTIFGIIATIIFSLILFTNGKKRYESLDI